MPLAVNDFPLSSERASTIEVLDHAPSTNDAALARAADLPDGAVILTDNQTSGRGRLGRVWSAPPGTMLAVSLVVRPKGLTPELFSWFPLIAGLAMSRALSTIISEPARVKWPNDVLIGEKKVCGILTELIPDLSGVVIGSGINLFLRPDELPTSQATSLYIAGARDVEPDRVLAQYLTEFDALYRSLLEHDGDVELSGVRQAVAAGCHTLGRDVRVELPGGRSQTGVAVGLDDSGRLVVETDRGLLEVAAGDVIHLRY